MGAIRRSGQPGATYLTIGVRRARFMTGGGYRLLASANFGELVLPCIEAKFCKKICVGISYLFEKKIEKRDMGRD